ncbi:MAG: hypothetical protein J7L51_02350 [Desulfurococcales archaeon]|nr:hypothetical protein [Desulfurococcales archaeon]
MSDEALLSERQKQYLTREPWEMPRDKLAIREIYDKAARNLLFFAEVILGFKIPPYWKEWARHLHTYDMLCVLAHRFSGKTSFFAFTYPLWRIFRGDLDEILFIRKTREDATFTVMKLKDEIESNPWLQFLSNPTGDTWGKQAIKTRPAHKHHHGVHVYGRGVGGSLRGLHPDLVIVDDIHGDKPSDVGVVKEYFFSVILPMLGPAGSKIIIIGTPISYDDLYADIRASNVIPVKEYPAILPDGRILWKDVWTREDLEKRRKLDEERFAREYLLQPKSTKHNFFPMDAIYAALDFERILGKPPKDAEFKDIVIGVDFGFAEDTRASYTVCTVLGLTFDNKRVILDIHREKGMGMVDIEQALERLQKYFNASRIVAEAIGPQKIVTEKLKDKFHVVDVMTTKQHKYDMLGRLRFDLEHKNIVIPASVNDKRTRELKDALLQELSGFIMREGKLISLSKHTDMVMSLAFANYYFSENETIYDLIQHSRGVVVTGERGSIPEGLNKDIYEGEEIEDAWLGAWLEW